MFRILACYFSVDIMHQANPKIKQSIEMLHSIVSKFSIELEAEADNFLFGTLMNSEKAGCRCMHKQQ